MPSIREVHDAFERLIAEQEQFASGLRAEADGLNQSAADAVEGVRGTIAEVVRSIIIDEAALVMLAEYGEPAPLDCLRKMRAANEHKLAEARRQLDDAASASRLSLLSERMQAARAEGEHARSEAEALMLRMTPFLTAIAPDDDAIIRRVAAYPAPFRLLRMINREARQIHDAASAYATLVGRDLVQDALGYVGQRKKQAEQATLFRDAVAAADTERRRLDDIIQRATADIEAASSPAGQAAAFHAALPFSEAVRRFWPRGR
jgi:hypothetical protein